MTRVCGECRLCCRVFPLPVIDKPADELCRFACSQGCSIHDHRMPDVCREYNCFWLDNDDLPDEFRPDRIGIVASESGVIRVGEHEMPVLRLNQSDPEACRGSTARGLIDGLLAAGAAVFLLCGPDLEILYDPEQYPGVTARDIEVAFRHAQSQDAEELKRFGAVTDDYRELTWDEAASSIAECKVPRDPNPRPPDAGES